MHAAALANPHATPDTAADQRKGSSTPEPSITGPLGPLSTEDRSLLHALSDASTDPASIAAAHNLDLTDLALWFAQPHIQRALEAIRALQEHHRKLWQEQAARDAVETLREVARTSEHPVERRRAASAILRALTAPNRPVRSTNSTTKPTTLDATMPSCPDAFPHINPPSLLSLRRSVSPSPPPLDPLIPRSPAPFPRNDPAALAESIADRLARLPDADELTVVEAIGEAVHRDIIPDRDARNALIDRLFDSPLLIPESDPDWTRTLHDTHVRGLEASRAITWRNRDGTTRACRILLRYDEGDEQRPPFGWCLADAINSDTS